MGAEIFDSGSGIYTAALRRKKEEKRQRRLSYCA
jgi:hypothetical protein